MNLSIQDVQAYDYARTIFTTYGRYLERNNIKEDTLDNYDDFMEVYDYDKNEIIDKKDGIDKCEDLKENLLDEMLCYIYNNSEDGYQMYITDKNNDDIYFNDIDELLDILNLKFSELENDIEDISYIEQFKEYKFKINNREYHLGEL